MAFFLVEIVFIFIKELNAKFWLRHTWICWYVF